MDFLNVKPATLEINCPKHGQHDKYIHSSSLGHDGYWCMLCWLESLAEAVARARVALSMPESSASTVCPITPPPELVQQWVANATGPDYEQVIATQAARWGSDQELEACCEWLGDAPVVYNDNGDLHPGSYLRDARRPKLPPSLKEQALEALAKIEDNEATYAHSSIIRRALKALDD